MKDNIIDRIQQYWELVGKSACPDDIVRDMSIDEIGRRLPKRSSVLDLGCGNGYCTFKFAETNIKSIIGADYSKTSVDQAIDISSLYQDGIKEKIDFKQDDALDLSFPDSTFDVVITIRCLINVGDNENQLKALKQIHRVLKPNGIYLMCENTISGLNNINQARTVSGLSEIKTRWHNNYIDENLFSPHLNKLFNIIEENHFASTYYLVSRVVNAWICNENNSEPKYEDEINKMASKLPAAGEFSPMRLYVLKKK